LRLSNIDNLKSSSGNAFKFSGKMHQNQTKLLVNFDGNGGL